MEVDLSMIVAMTLDGVIGKEGRIPWRIPSDMRRFRDITTKIGTLIMGRKTLEEILERGGKPLPGRRHIVLTRGEIPNSHDERVKYVHSVEAALAAVAAHSMNACVIGGAEIYQLFLKRPELTTIYLTTVYPEKEITGDTRLPSDIRTGWIDTEYKTRPQPPIARLDPEDEHQTSFIIGTRPQFGRKMI